MDNPLPLHLLSILLLAGCASLPITEVRIQVRNRLDFDRPAETLSLPWKAVADRAPGWPANRLQANYAEGGAPLPIQVLDLNGDGTPEEVLLSVAVPAGATRTVVVSLTSTPLATPRVRTFGRFVPERKDDFAWENDKVAFRMYGPALAAEGVDGGVDCWLKRVPYPIINKWYKGNLEGVSYHRDQGEGYDPYHVGGTRGCGGLGIWHGGRLHPTGVFQRWRLLANGPVRTLFELDYEYSHPRGATVRETKRISLDLGERLSRFESRFAVEGQVAGFTLAVGLTTHKGRAQGSRSPRGWVSCWETIDGQGLGTALLMDRQRIHTVSGPGLSPPHPGHLLLLAQPDTNNRIVYHAGFGWQRAGEITTNPEWQEYLHRFKRRLGSPLEADLHSP